MCLVEWILGRIEKKERKWRRKTFRRLFGWKREKKMMVGFRCFLSGPTKKVFSTKWGEIKLGRGNLMAEIKLQNVAFFFLSLLLSSAFAFSVLLSHFFNTFLGCCLFSFFFFSCLSFFCFDWASFFNKDILVYLYKLTCPIPSLFHSPNKQKRDKLKSFLFFYHFLSFHFFTWKIIRYSQNTINVYWWDLPFIWEEGVCIYGTEGVCIYGTLGVHNNFPFHPSNQMDP